MVCPSDTMLILKPRTMFGKSGVVWDNMCCLPSGSIITWESTWGGDPRGMTCHASQAEQTSAKRAPITLQRHHEASIALASDLHLALETS
jgi:hypothetical protein